MNDLFEDLDGADLAELFSGDDPSSEAPRTTSLFPALERALQLNEIGYICTPATTFETVVFEFAPVRNGEGKLVRDLEGSFKKALQAVQKPAKVTIGRWGNASAGVAGTMERFRKQLDRVLDAAQRLKLDQDARNLGAGIITSRSGVAVIDVDCGKVPDIEVSGALMDPEVAHDILIGDLLRTAGMDDAELEAELIRFKSSLHVRTPSGGRHYYFRRKPEQKPRTHTGAIRYVDVRAGFPTSDGEFESSGVAYAPGNVTAKGEYVVRQLQPDGTFVVLPTLPPVAALPELPDELNSLFEKPRADIHRIAVSLGVAVPERTVVSNRSPAQKARTTSYGGGCKDDLIKWDRLAGEFVCMRKDEEGVA